MICILVESVFFFLLLLVVCWRSIDGGGVVIDYCVGSDMVGYFVLKINFIIIFFFWFFFSIFPSFSLLLFLLIRLPFRILLSCCFLFFHPSLFLYRHLSSFFFSFFNTISILLFLRFLLSSFLLYYVLSLNLPLLSFFSLTCWS